jgi:hypothetical protein
VAKAKAFRRSKKEGCAFHARQLGSLSSCPSTLRARGRSTFTRRPPITSEFGTSPELELVCWI